MNGHADMNGKHLQEVCTFLTLLGLFVEVSESHWLLCGVRSVCHLAPWSNVTTVSTAPSAKPVKIENLHFPLGTQGEREKQLNIEVVHVTGNFLPHVLLRLLNVLVCNECVSSPSVSTLVM